MLSLLTYFERPVPRKPAYSGALTIPTIQRIRFSMVRGIRYINTGAWMAFPSFYLLVTPDRMILKKVRDSLRIM